MLARFLVPIIMSLALVGLPPAAPSGGSLAPRAYVEPKLLTTDSASLDVIVTGTDSRLAADAVEAAGGTVTSTLWLINAVAATVPTDNLERLATDASVVSIVQNKGVETAGEFDGWVTDRRILLNWMDLGDTQPTPAAALPDGGAVIVTLNGKLVFLEDDGSVRQQINLAGTGYMTEPQIAPNGVVYVANDTRVYAVDASTAATVWVYSLNGTSKFTSGPILGNDGTVYLTVDGHNIYAFEPAAGKIIWHHNLSGDKIGQMVAPPAIAADGTIYAVTSGQSSTPSGHVFALNPDGTLKWAFTGLPGDYFDFAPHVAADGTVYVASPNGGVYAINPDSTLKYHVALPETLAFAPVVQPGGALYVASATTLFALNPDGSERFHAKVSGKATISASPVVSPDGRQVLFVAQRRLFAVDAVSGSELWRYNSNDDLGEPAVETDGTIHVGNLSGKYALLTADGEILSEIEGLQPINGKPILSSQKRVYLRAGSQAAVALGPLPNKWNGQPDVQATDEWKKWKMVNPVAVDVGADLLHAGIGTPDGGKYTGQGVTVAVIDSGVYFSAEVKRELGSTVDRHFLGQVDFVGDGTCASTDTGKYKNSVVQYDGYCWTDHLLSRDGYGHGSHVAGIIWNNLQDYATGVTMGIAPGASVLSVRVLNDDGMGTYADAIEGIQYVIQNKDALNIRIINLSMSADPTTPYFVDPLNRAVEQAWANGIVVVAAAGNTGPAAETITVPGNDPYVITVGALDNRRTPGYWIGDDLPAWSATGPTLDGFVKPDILAPGSQIVSFMYNDPNNMKKSAKLVQEHPDYSETVSLFRMNGTSMATAIVSGVVALMLEAHPELTPDQVKFRLGYSARAALTDARVPEYSLLQQGMGRVWAPAAVLGDFPANDRANQGMDIASDLAHGYSTEQDLAFHYQGPVRKMLSDDGATVLYYIEDETGAVYGLGASRASDHSWLDWDTLSSGIATWSGGAIDLDHGMQWAGGFSKGSGIATWSGGIATWSGGIATWSGGIATWSGGIGTWSGGIATWSGGIATWSGGVATWSGGIATWSGSIDLSSSSVSSTTWVDDWNSTASLGTTMGTSSANHGGESLDEQVSVGVRTVYLPTVIK